MAEPDTHRGARLVAYARGCDEALSGRFSRLDRLEAEAHERDPAADDGALAAWRSIAASLRFLAGMPQTNAPDPAALALLGGVTGEVAAIAADAAARTCTVAVLHFDGRGAHASALQATGFANRSDTPAAAVRAAVAAAWSGVATGRSLDDRMMHDVEQRARKLGLAELVIDLAALRALGWDDRGVLDDALASARRAARMARTEKLPQSEYLAAVVLARLRRLSGRPYLATRITAALRRFASRPWWSWIEWEGQLAGGLSTTTMAATQGPAVLLRRVLTHAHAGQRAGFDSAARELADAVADFAPLRRDLDRVVAAVDVHCDLAAADPGVRRWCYGEAPFEPPPFGLAGLVGAEPLDTAAARIPAVVVARPDRPGRRVLRIACALAATDVGALEIDEDRVGRSEGLLSALALAGPEGLDDEELFRRAYGFNYVRTQHRGTFDVALHRARTRVDGRGAIERASGRICLHVDRAFAVPDPRTQVAADERVLGRLADGGEIAARELAALLGMPLRTVQGSLRSLVDGGVCQQRRDGRRVVYALEDTTFQEPTLA